MLNENDEKLIGACGINCATCDIHLAHVKGDVEEQRKIVKAIFGEDTEVAPEQITCDGCGGRLDVHWSPDCRMMQCVHDKGLLACSQCPEFPCPDLEAFYTKEYENAKQNALRQRDIGLDAWWKEQQESRS